MLIYNNWHNTDSFLIIFALNKTGVWMRVQHWHLDLETEGWRQRCSCLGFQSQVPVFYRPSVVFPRYQWTINCTYLKYTVWCILTFMRAHETNDYHNNELFHRPWKSQCGFEISPSSPSCPASLPGHAATDGLSVLLQMSLYFLECHIWGITQNLCLYCLAFFTQQLFQYHPVLLPVSVVTFYCWVVFHCMD